MGFDTKKFSKAKYDPRTEIVRITSKSLIDMFGPDDEPVFTVRGLTGEEMARSNEASKKQRRVAEIAEALAGEGSQERVQALRESLGLSHDNVPEDLARRIEMVHLGCVDPELDEQMASKVFKVATVDGYALSNKILQLSQQGMIPGESKASGKKATSKQPSPSDTPEAK